jgi:hypothetical protein
MGREIRKVPLDFDWPLKKVWAGFENPYSNLSHGCPICDSSGYNQATKKISDDWYDFDHTGRRWSEAITQDEVEALVAHGRLQEFVGYGYGRNDDGTWYHWEKGAKSASGPPQMPDAATVNMRSRDGLIHDAINRWICVETRARRLGVWGHCDVCDGEGEVWESQAAMNLYEGWKKQEPPTGDGFQVWETVSEGSPVSPVFATSDAMVVWLVGQGYSKQAAENFVASECAPTMLMVNGAIYRDIESCS